MIYMQTHNNGCAEERMKWTDLPGSNPRQFRDQLYHKSYKDSGKNNEQNRDTTPQSL
jgi:hypothetical protein